MVSEVIFTTSKVICLDSKILVIMKANSKGTLLKERVVSEPYINIIDYKNGSFTFCQMCSMPLEFNLPKPAFLKHFKNHFLI